MGLAESKGNATQLVECYRRYGLVTGGAECRVIGGGLGDLDKYSQMPLSDAKKNLIRDIASALADKLKITSVSPNGKSVEQIVADLKKYIPDPRVGKGNGKTWSDKENLQVKACKVVAEVLNTKFDGVINMSASPDEMCEQVSELVYTMFLGLQAEFLAVKKDAERVLKNINTLENFLEDGYQAIIRKIHKNTESNLKYDTAVLEESHNDVMKELKRQRSMLQNLLDVIIKPHEADLEDLAKDSDELKNFVKKIKRFPGTKEFGQKIAFMLDGFNNVAAAAHIVDKALTKAGISYQDYAKLKSDKKLREMLNNKTQSLMNGPEDELYNYEKAKEVLLNFQYMHDQIVDELSKKKGRGEAEAVVGGLRLDKKVRRRQELKKSLLKTFNSRVGSLVDVITQAAKQISESVNANNINLTDALDKFARALDELPDLQKRYVYMSLSGYNDDVQSRQDREQFVSQLKYLVSTIDAVLQDKENARLESFRDMKTGFEELIKVVEVFAQKFTSDFGPYVPARGRAEDDAVTGRGEKDICAEDLGIDGGDEENIIPEIARISYNLERAKDLIRYSFRTAKIRYNLRNVSGELKSYADDYNRILGDAVASAVDDAIDAKNRYTSKNYSDSNHPLHLAFQDCGNDTSKMNKIVEFIAKEFDIKINTYRLAEAVDLYMKAFTDGIASKPDEIRDLVSVLESTEVVSKWFSNKSGDLLCQVFDSFPHTMDAATPKLTRLNAMTDGHYYLRVAAITCSGDVGKISGNPNFSSIVPSGTANWEAWAPRHYPLSDGATTDTPVLPGNPLLGIPIEKKSNSDETLAREMLNTLEKANATSLLKNIVALFINVGKKFGDVVLEKQTHLSPIQIYKHLLNYMIYGSVTFGSQNGANHIAEGVEVNAGVSNYQKYSYVTLRAVGGSRNANLVDIFDDCDKLFEMVIKSITAKVLTVVGTYSMFNKPINKNGLGYQAGLRTILGGDDSVKVIPEALELYMRLPLLAEFYRALFKFTDDASSQNFRQITLLPEFDGVFSGLINLIFDKARYVESGEYSDMNVRDLITEINKIYNKFSGRKSMVTDAINEFILEVNRRYGVLKSEERKRYLDERRDRFNSKYSSEESVTDYALEGLDENQNDFRPAPSMSYQTKGTNSGNQANQHKYNLDLNDNAGYVKQLRDDLNDLFKAAQQNLNARDLNTLRTKISFTPMLLSSQEELKNAKSDTEKYEIVKDAINSLGEFTMSNLEKNLLLFHEAVIHPLNNLYATQVALAEFENRINKMHELVGMLSKPYADINDFINANSLVIYKSNGIGANEQGNGAVAITAAQLQTAFNGTDDKARELRERFLVDQEVLMHNLMETLYAHATSFEGGVDLKFDVKKSGNSDTCSIVCYVDHSNLFETVTKTFEAVKRNVDKFRGLIPKETLRKYEEFSESNKSSLYSIEKNLVMHLMQGKRTGNSGEFEALDKVNSKIKDLFKHLTRTWTVNAGHILSPGNASVNETHKFSKVLDKLIYALPDAADGNDGAITLARANKNNNLFRLLFNTSGAEKKGVANGAPWPDVPANYKSGDINRLDDANYSILVDNKRSLFYTFNRLVLSYLSNVYEHTVSKVYASTIDKFANGAFNSAIAGSANFNNGIDYADVSSLLNGPDHKGVLLKTTALMFRQLLTEMDKKGLQKQYLESNLQEIPLFVKERLRANLPVFETLFKMFVARCEVLRHMVKGLDVTRDGRSRGQHENDLTEMLDQFVEGSNALVQCCRDTLKALNDKGLYLETRADFISTYTAENGKMPYMPLSSMAYALRNMTAKQEVAIGNGNDSFDKPFLPQHNVGENPFKLVYAVRKIFHSTPSMNDLPGMRELLKNHNASAEARHELKEKDYEELVLNNVKLSKYLLNLKHYVSVLTQLNAGDLNASRASSSAFVDFNITENAVYQLASGVNLANVVNLTESTSQKENKNKVVGHIEVTGAGLCPKTKSRKDMLVYNIIDLNVLPINVHALMREIPLINLINYSATFDHMVNELYHTEDINCSNEIQIDDLLGKGDKDAVEKNPTRTLFTTLLKNPYCGVSMDVYANYVSAMIRGNMGIAGLGRPKYLADEVYNKVLFGELYPGHNFMEEAGPSSGHGHLRGKQEILADQTLQVPNWKDFLIELLVAAFDGYNSDHFKDVLTSDARKDVYRGLMRKLYDDLQNPSFKPDELLDKYLTKATAIDKNDRPTIPDADFTPANENSYLWAASKGANLLEKAKRTRTRRTQRLLGISMVLLYLLDMPQVKEQFVKAIKNTLTRMRADKNSGMAKNAFVNKFNSDDTLRYPLNWVGELATYLDVNKEGDAYDFSKIQTIVPGADVNRVEVEAKVRKLSQGPNSLKINSIDAKQKPDAADVKERRKKMAGIIFDKFAIADFVRLPRAQQNELQTGDHFPDALHYLKSGNVVKVDLKEGQKYKLQTLGKLRFDTVLIRNLVWLTNIQRTLRLALQRDLEWFDTKVVNELAVTAPSITESYGNKDETD